MQNFIIFIVCILTILSNSKYAVGQELFPNTEPASTMPKNVLGIRVFSESYKEVKQVRNMSALRFMYGIRGDLTTYATLFFSNHHNWKMPEDFPFHNAPERGKVYPFKFDGAHVYLKYRFWNIDRQNTHFRAAAYLEGAYVNTTHHESEPDLFFGDNKGIGGGFIFTYLKNKFAISSTVGYIHPFDYVGVTPDPIIGLPDIPMRMQYGRTVAYSLSLGYLLLPRKYENYDQGNLNLYLEFRGKAFGNSKVDLFYGTNREYYVINNRYPPALKSGYFLDITPGIQYIYKSNLRIDFSASFRGIGFSYARLYPVFHVGIQRYFYL